MPKPIPPTADATDLPTSVHIGRLAVELSELEKSKVDRSADEKARIDDQKIQRTAAQVYLYASLADPKPDADLDKGYVQGLIDREVSRLRALLPSGGGPLSPSDQQLKDKADRLASLSVALN